MLWRKWNKILHRDLGYLCVGLTVVYAISGIAVNHVGNWNPSYRLERIQSTIDPGQVAVWSAERLVPELLTLLGVSGKLKDSYRPDPQTIKIFLEENTITVNLMSGEVIQELVRPRAVLHQLNVLHLNHRKKLWTWFADLYAVALCLLAITGMFVLRGSKGLTGRGFWLTGIGITIPVFFVWFYG